MRFFYNDKETRRWYISIRWFGLALASYSYMWNVQLVQKGKGLSTVCSQAWLLGKSESGNERKYFDKQFFFELRSEQKSKQIPPWLCGLIILDLILPSYYMDYHRSCIGIPQKPTSIIPQFRSILTIFIHRGNGDVSTLDWSEVPEGILHYEDFPIFVSPWKTVVIFEHVFSWKRWWKRGWMVLWV